MRPQLADEAVDLVTQCMGRRDLFNPADVLPPPANLQR